MSIQIMRAMSKRRSMRTSTITICAVSSAAPRCGCCLFFVSIAVQLL